MPSEKLFTVKQAAEAVLKKAHELLEKSEFVKAEKLEKTMQIGHTLKGPKPKGNMTMTPILPKPHKPIEIPVKKAEHQPHPGPSKSEHQKIYDAKKQAESEAHLKTSTGNAERIKGNIERLGKAENSGKENAKPNEHNSKDADQHANGPAPKGEIHPHEKEAAPSDEVRTQKDPQHNPAEQKEGNNELNGTTPNQVGPDGKNIPGFDEMKGHLKLAKFIGHMGAKRQMRSAALPKISG